ncbi:hypothetical protein PLICRDRAFT_91766 [Plicaturopsis crispa FD-325 SS-3]|nr:hypothetical protein PLICRDRAFT_91766 [Plicaturopsis crispa FD-325 SS-3]
MIAPPTGRTLAYASDIPGSRLAPEDGPFPYQELRDQDVWTELAALAKPQSTTFDSAQAHKADSINFQPCHVSRTQDRYVVQQLNIHGRMWTLTGVFDGHLGDSTVEHTAFHMPIIIRNLLLDAFKDDPSRLTSPAFIADLLARSITSFDDAIANDVLGLFPGGIDALSRMSNKEIQNIINDQNDGGRNYQKAKLCMHGTTALISLVDPERENLWVANLGDCQAVLVSHERGEEWNIQVLTKNHNGDNDAEVDRVRSEHPGEPGCVVDRRVLGAIAPFRCIGDVPFKQPPEFTRRILYNLYPGFHDTSPWEEFLVRNRTPPYISAQPEVTHHALSLPASTPRRQFSPQTRPARFLILTSDGFSDLCHGGAGEREVIGAWARSMVGRRSLSEKSDNMALRLLWHALGGEDSSSVSRVLTLDMDGPWIDDTAIVVQTL